MTVHEEARRAIEAIVLVAEEPIDTSVPSGSARSTAPAAPSQVISMSPNVRG